MVVQRGESRWMNILTVHTIFDDDMGRVERCERDTAHTHAHGHWVIIPDVRATHVRLDHPVHPHRLE